MIKYTKGFKEVTLYGFSKFVEKWNKYYCLDCKQYFKKPKELYNRPNVCCRDDAWDDGFDYYCPKCGCYEIEYPIDVARKIWNKERPKDTV